MSGEPTFEIALVLAGAVSGGAYTAGVLDFLIEALDEWESAKRAGRTDVPNHRVVVRVLAGTSAGAIGCALGARELASRRAATPPSDGAPYCPLLHLAWVERPDIAGFCGDADLKKEGPVRSLLDATVLDRIVDDVLGAGATFEPRAYLADPFEVILTCTNLRGVPYRVRFEDGDYDSLSHADSLQFYVGGAPPDWGAPLRLNEDQAPWRELFEAALASSAFPAGLAARRMKRDRGDYEKQTWQVMVTHNGSDYRPVEREMEPYWRSLKGEAYPFVSVDGGVLDNEPLDLARRALARHGQPFPDGEDATRATVMIDPFPDPSTPLGTFESDDSLLSALRGTLGALLRQQRFKPEEILLAQDETVFSRFLIAPSRRGDDGKPEDRYPLATASLGHFGGFLAQAFREHDYRLGRRNCQKFLQEHFALPADNPVVARWPAEAAKAPYQLESERRGASGERLAFRVLVPCVGRAAAKIPLDAWPRLTNDEVASLRPALARRCDAVAARAIESASLGWPRGLLARLAWRWFLRRPAVDRVMAAIQDDLGARELMGAPGAAERGALKTREAKT